MKVKIYEIIRESMGASDDLSQNECSVFGKFSGFANAISTKLLVAIEKAKTFILSYTIRWSIILNE